MPGELTISQVDNKIKLVWTYDPDVLVTNGLVLHLDADAIEGLNDNDAVAAWSDLSGKGNDAEQLWADYRPTYKTNILNGKSVVRFDGTDDHLFFPRLDGGEKSIVVVFRATLADGTFGSLVSPKTPTGDLYSEMIVIRISGYKAWVARFDYLSVGDSVGLDIAYDADWHVFAGVYDGGGNSSVASYMLKLDGKGDVVSTVELGRAEGDDSTIGGRAPAANSAFLNGDIAEILIYDRALTTQEREDVEQYLGVKWLGWE